MKPSWPIAVLLALTGPASSAEQTVAGRVAQFGDAADKRLAPHFAAAGVRYPPSRVTFIGLKQERQLQLYAAGPTGAFHFVRAYPILAASGNLGPKLREGDAQVPEGLYRIESLNPNSRFHLSLRVSYPNAFDREQAKAEGRRNLGGDIMIHGNAVSIGCLAMGDVAAEDLFVLAHRTGLRNIQVILSPVDFRDGKRADFGPAAPQWLDRLYKSISAELARYARPQVAQL